IGEFKDQLGETPADRHFGTPKRFRGSFFCDFCGRGFAPSTKITLAEKRRRELTPNVGRLQNGGLIFSNNLSYTPG
ncbi:MAG: hypothetical protein JW892_15535, partial [Anaerolineae bacterium]|nr:hypothetical protein [Anaerolineae bacterium]